jgi:hypothetical protein
MTISHTPDCTLAEFKAILRDEKRIYTYADLHQKYNVNGFYLWHIINTPDYIPPPKVRMKLGIQHFELTPVCPIHGIVHLSKRCPPKRKPARTMLDYPVQTLRAMIENRKEF